MRGMPVDEDDEEAQTEDEQFVRRLAEGAEEAAAFYRRISDETRKEFKFLQGKLELLTKEQAATQNQQILDSIEDAERSPKAG